MALLAGIGTVSANLVQNPSFELPPITGPFVSCPVGSIACPSGGITDWTAIGSVNLINGYWTSSTGSQSIDMSGEDARGTLSQLIDTTTSGPYTLSFDMSGNFDCGPQTIRNLSVYWNNNFVEQFSFPKPSGWDHSLTGMGWTEQLVILPAVPSAQHSTELRFVDTSAGVDNCGAALDNLNLVAPQQSIPTPEFPSVALPAALIVGLIGGVLFIKSTKEN